MPAYSFGRIARRAALVLSLLFALPASAGEWFHGAYLSWTGSRLYQAWIPTGYSYTRPMPAVVLLHGCAVGPDLSAYISRMNEIADREGFIAIYPQQNPFVNPSLCWNFMLSINQQRDSGEPKMIKGILDLVKSRYRIDGSRVYVMGISAGGGMTSIMAACYPEVFAAAAVHSGGMYKGAVGLLSAADGMLNGSSYDPDQRGRDAWECGGSRRLTMPVLVFHGSSDIVVHPTNGDQAVQQFLQTSDYADDGLPNDSIAYRPTETIYATVPDGGRSYRVDSYHYGGKLMARKYTVYGMNHAWSGGRAGMPFSDERGPDASQISWDFFKNFTR